tara:strand:- start:295 stop:477 length:183 start_codon:yes stop_codon:yes gene_type:complete
MKKKQKQIVEYYFKNPSANSMNEMVSRFKVNAVTIKNILSEELERRLENSLTRRLMKKYD